MNAAEQRIRPGGQLAASRSPAFKEVFITSTTGYVLLPILRTLRAASATLALILLLQLAVAGPAFAAETGGNHVFDAVRSLTGSGTLVAPVDPVPDPGPNHPPTTFFETGGVAVDN
jgi:hypothetical protein